MSDAPASKKTSPFMTFIYIVIAVVAVSFFLEMTGMADVAGKREHEEIIDRPHDR